MEIIVKNKAGGGFIDSDLVKRLGLNFENGGMPATREKGRIGSKQQPGWTNHVDSAPEDGTQIEVLIHHPAIRTRRVEINVGTKIAKHQRFTEVTGSEMRD